MSGDIERLRWMACEARVYLGRYWRRPIALTVPETGAHLVMDFDGAGGEPLAMSVPASVLTLNVRPAVAWLRGAIADAVGFD